MTCTGAFTYALPAISRAVLLRFSALASMNRLASSRAMTSARAVWGYCSIKARVVPSTFSGWSGQICWVVVAVKPIVSKIARAPQGSPTQKPSMLPTRMLATICGGGTVMVFTSLSGLMPWAASQ
ncbi:hypothetical protein D3C77_564120 [compost metagenome]